MNGLSHMHHESLIKIKVSVTELYKPLVDLRSPVLPRRILNNKETYSTAGHKWTYSLCSYFHTIRNETCITSVREFVSYLF
jgi:hypothetical protein